MSRENISYAKCNCDICRKEEHIAQSLILPNGWDTLKFEGVKLELCKECKDKIKYYLEAWIKDKRIP